MLDANRDSSRRRISWNAYRVPLVALRAPNTLKAHIVQRPAGHYLVYGRPLGSGAETGFWESRTSSAQNAQKQFFLRGAKAYSWASETSTLLNKPRKWDFGQGRVFGQLFIAVNRRKAGLRVVPQWPDCIWLTTISTLACDPTRRPAFRRQTDRFGRLAVLPTRSIPCALAVSRHSRNESFSRTRL